jgi:HlyD family type I secretion membrane fusion protein
MIVQPGEAGERLSLLTRQARWSIWAFVAILMLSSSVLRVTGAVIANGSLVDLTTAEIAHPVGGTLTSINVHPGSAVVKGSILMTIDSTAIDRQAQAAKINRFELLARRARLQAEQSGRSRIDFPADVLNESDLQARNAIVTEQMRFRQSRSARLEEERLLANQISQLEAIVVQYSTQIEANKRQLELINAELVDLRALKARGLVTIPRVNASERAAIQLEANHSALEASRLETEGRMAALRQQHANERYVRIEQLDSELSQIARELGEQIGRMETATNEATKTIITAPVSGTVEQLAYRTLGSAIPGNARIMTIVPASRNRQVEAKVNPRDIDLVISGQRVRMILATAGDTSRMELDGKVDYIAADATIDDRSGNSYYSVRVSLNAGALSKARELRNGTPVEVYFVTTDRSLLSYLLRPLSNQLIRAFRS